MGFKDCKDELEVAAFDQYADSSLKIKKGTRK